MLNQGDYELSIENSGDVDKYVDNSDFSVDQAEDGLPWGESYVADMISNKFENLLSYRPGQNIWYLWNGIIHVPMQDSLVIEEIVDMFSRHYEKAYQFVEDWHLAKARHAEAQGLRKGVGDDPKQIAKDFERDFKKHMKFRDRLRGPENRNKVIADSKRKLAVSPRKFEDDTKWFVFRDGVIDCEELREHGTCKVLPHNYERNVTRFFDANYYEDGDPEKGPAGSYGYWQDFLESSIPDDEVRKFVQACVGAGFSGNTKLRTFLIFEGARSSGKSLFLETFAELGRRSDPDIIDTAYAHGNAPEEAILRRPGKSNFAQSEFGNHRFVGISELSANEELNGEFIKKYTGDKTVSTERKHQGHHSDIAQGLLVIATNEMPRINSMDTAIMKRAKIVKFPRSFIDDPDPKNENEFKSVEGLGEMLLDDRSDVLHWIIEGMLIHKTEKNNNGISYSRLEDSAPSVMNSWMDELKSELQTPVSWLEFMRGNDSIEYVPDSMEILSRKVSTAIRTSEAYKVYLAWCEDNGISYPVKNRKFTKMILDEYGISGHDRTVGNDYSRFPFLFTSDKFDSYLLEAKTRVQ